MLKPRAVKYSLAARQRPQPGVLKMVTALSVAMRPLLFGK
jgi:hypothetical protein